MPLKEKTIKKIYYSIGEVAVMFDVNKSLIRFWEKEFSIIKPKKNKKGNYIHFKFKGSGKVVDELEKNERIDKNLLKYLTVKVKKFDLDTNYFTKSEDIEKTDKKEKNKN